MEKCWEGREWAIRYDRCVGMITIVPIWLPFCRYDLRLPVWLPLYRNCHRCAGMATVVSEWLPSDLSHDGRQRLT